MCVRVFHASALYTLQMDETANGECVPEIGCLVNGLFLDGAAWCRCKNHLVEPKNGILYDEMVTVSIYSTMLLPAAADVACP